MNPACILGYARVSTQRQFVEGHGLERYIDQLKAYGIPEENIFWDVESGGSNTRKGYNRILELLRTGQYKRVVIPLFERFGRSVSLLEEARKEFINLGVEMVILSEGDKVQDLESPLGVLKYQVQSMMAEYVKNTNTSQSVQGHRYHRKKLKPYLPCFGYDLINDKLIPNLRPYKNTNKTYWQVARDLYLLYLELGETSATIKAFTLEYGYERIGHRHHDWPRDWSSLRYWLLNPMLRGTLVYFPKNKDKRIEHLNQHDALITEDEYLRAKSLLLSRTCLRGGSDKPRNPLAGLAFCSNCGSAMKSSASKSGGDYKYYLLCTGAYPKVGIPKTCDRRSSYSLEIYDCVDSVIASLIQKSKEISEWVSIPEEQDNNKVDPEVIELQNQIKKLELMADDDLSEALEIKRTKLRNLLLRTTESTLIDLSKRDTLFMFIQDPTLWDKNRPELLKPIFAELIRRVECDKGVIVKVELNL